MVIVLQGPNELRPFDEAWGTSGSVQTLVTFSLSVFSGCFGMSKFFNVGPSRLIPYDKMNLGFFVLMANIASCFIGKGVLLIFGKSARNQDLQWVYNRFLTWICLSLLPQIIFVSTYYYILKPRQCKISAEYNGASMSKAGNFNLLPFIKPIKS